MVDVEVRNELVEVDLLDRVGCERQPTGVRCRLGLIVPRRPDYALGLVASQKAGAAADVVADQRGRYQAGGVDREDGNLRPHGDALRLP